jgi:hypothetical protein
LEAGAYVFLLYVSDVQEQVTCFYNVTIVPAQVFAVTVPDFTASFTFYAGNDVAHPCSQYPPAPAIAVPGNYSWSTLSTATLSYLWTQTDGDPLDYQCDPDGFTPTRAIFNTTESVMWFVPPGPGWYCFQLVVSDGITNSTPAYVCVEVFPDFGQPPSTLTPIENYTAPPLEYLTQPPVPHIPFDNATFPPFNTFPPGPQPAPVETNVTPMFPNVGPMRSLDIIAYFVVCASSLLFFVFVAMLFRAFGEANEYGFLDKKVHGGSYNRLWSL